jgi:hypothetical protein
LLQHEKLKILFFDIILNFRQKNHHYGLDDGKHLSEFAKIATKKIANKVGQALWDFYMYQIHILKKYMLIHILGTS